MTNLRVLDDRLELAAFLGSKELQYFTVKDERQLPRGELAS